MYLARKFRHTVFVSPTRRRDHHSSAPEFEPATPAERSKAQPTEQILLLKQKQNKWSFMSVIKYPSELKMLLTQQA